MRKFRINFKQIYWGKMMDMTVVRNNVASIVGQGDK